jgi:ankyrin repeat protein
MFQRLLQVPGIEINGEVLDSALRKNKQMVQDLLNLNVDPNDEESGGRFPVFGVFPVDKNGTPLNDDAAARDLIKLLIAHGANMEVANDGETLLMLAVQQSKLKTAEELLKSDAKATLNSKDQEGHTALWYANQLTTSNKDAIIKLLKNAGAKE